MGGMAGAEPERRKEEPGELVGGPRSARLSTFMLTTVAARAARCFRGNAPIWAADPCCVDHRLGAPPAVDPTLSTGKFPKMVAVDENRQSASCRVALPA
jgi:hypothetical protein